MDSWSVEQCKACLLDQSEPVAKRNRCIFIIRSIHTNAKANGDDKAAIDAVEALAAALTDPSTLLAHEAGYVAGQMGDPHAVPYLTAALENENLDVVVRHECAESLGGIGLEESLPVLDRYARDPHPEVAETCELAAARIRWMLEHGKGAAEAKSVYDTTDPAPAYPLGTKTVEELRAELLDESKPLFTRYRALFTLRNEAAKADGTAEEVEAAVLALADGLTNDKKSALFRHEVAFVCGMLQHEAAVPALVTALQNKNEHEMVRHEAAEAAGSVGGDAAVAVLDKFRDDKDVIVAQSCDVALDIADYWTAPEAAEEE